MSQPSDAAWNLLRQAASHSADAARGAITNIPDSAHPLLVWHQDCGWRCTLDESDPRRALIDLYLPFCSATTTKPITVGHLGQSLDGFIATHTGDSQWVTGHENVVHMHRLRALSDAVVVGAGTVAVDDPRLTTRLVDGPNPLRVVIDPDRRLAGDHHVFTDGAAETVYACARALVRAGETRFGRAEILAVEGSDEGLDLPELMRLLRDRGAARVFVEGGGVTVSMFLQAGLLDRLHLTIAPLLIGDGRAAIRLPAPTALDDCHRPSYRVFRMGGDVLFDCDLRSRDTTTAPADVARVI